MVFADSLTDSDRIVSGNFPCINREPEFSEEALPGWWRVAIQRISFLLSLPENWDSYGAQKVDASRAYTAVQILQQIARPGIPKPSIVPTPTGDIQFEWHINDIDLEIEVSSPVKLGVSFEDLRTGAEWEEDLDYDLTRLVDVIKELVNRVKDDAARAA